MAYNPHRDFNPNGPFIALRPFTMDGRDYTYDEPVDLTGVELRRVRLMWEARHIDVAPAPPPQVQEPVVEPQKARRSPRKAAEVPEPTKAPEAPVEAPVVTEGLTMVSKGFGRWSVLDANGNVVEAGLTKADAERRVTGMGT